MTLTEMSVRDAFNLAGYTIPDEYLWWYKISPTKFKIFKDRDDSGLMFGPGVGVTDEIWFMDHWYTVSFFRSLEDPCSLHMGFLAKEVQDWLKVEGYF